MFTTTIEQHIMLLEERQEQYQQMQSFYPGQDQFHVYDSFTVYYIIIYITTRIIKNIFNNNERICRDVKTQKACKQSWEAIAIQDPKSLPYNPT